MANKSTVTDHLVVTVKGPKSSFSFEMYFARDPARTPLLVNAVCGGDVLDGAGPAERLASRFSLRCRHRRAVLPIIRGAGDRRCEAGGCDGIRPAAKNFDPARFDIPLYHMGNNPCHDFVYETALRHPGVVVMHEANLHHLVAHVTISRGDWDTYVAECEYNGGAAALAFAHG